MQIRHRNVYGPLVFRHARPQQQLTVGGVKLICKLRRARQGSVGVFQGGIMPRSDRSRVTHIVSAVPLRQAEQLVEVPVEYVPELGGCGEYRLVGLLLFWGRPQYRRQHLHKFKQVDHPRLARPSFRVGTAPDAVLDGGKRVALRLIEPSERLVDGRQRLEARRPLPGWVGLVGKLLHMVCQRIHVDGLSGEGEAGHCVVHTCK